MMGHTNSNERKSPINESIPVSGKVIGKVNKPGAKYFIQCKHLANTNKNSSRLRQVLSWAHCTAHIVR